MVEISLHGPGKVFVGLLNKEEEQGKGAGE